MTKRVPRGNLVHDERSGLCVAEGARQLGRLHRSQRGNIAVLFLFLGIVFYCLMAMVWNTGKITSAKIETQTAADAAAYSSAVWTSRVMNMTVATNMLILRNASAHIAAAAAAITETGFQYALTMYLIYRAGRCALDCPAPPPVFVNPVCYAACYGRAVLNYSWAQAALQQVAGTARVGINAYHSRKLLNRIDGLYKLQQDLITAAGKAIEEQRKAMEDYYDCDIYLMGWDPSGQAVSGDKIRPPLKRGRNTSLAFPLLARAGWEGYSPMHRSWRRSQEFLAFPGPGRMHLMEWFWPVQARQIWMFASIAAYAEMVDFPPGLGSILAPLSALGVAPINTDVDRSHHVLTTQSGFLEYGPLDLDEWKPFTIVAVARKRSDNTKSGQPPARPLDLMAPGLFRHQVVPMAYAQAETFHGIDGHVANAAGAWAPLRIIGAYPFRMWTTWGWQWQPRLNRGDQLGNAIQDDADFKSWLQEAGVNAPGDVNDLMLH
jgi:hypothetical protein